jgi:hypothetical protein
MSVTREQVLAIKTFSEVAKLLKEQPNDMRVVMKGDVLVHIQNLINTRNSQLAGEEAKIDQQIENTAPAPSTEELAAQAAVVASQPDPSVPVPAAEPKKKIVREYQVRDEDGTPIGRPTHLEAYTEAEMLDKMQVAHESATRAFHRLKKQKLQFKEEEQKRVLSPEEIKAAAAKAVEAKDGVEAERLVRGLLDAEFKDRETKLQAEKDFQYGVRVANEFVMKHLYDFNPVRSNMVALTDYLKENSLDLTLANLEAAFLDLNEQGDKLAPPAVQYRSVEPTTNTAVTTAPAATPVDGNPVVEQPVVATPPAVAQPEVSTPPVAATVTTPVVANQPTATRRPGVNGSLPPGSLSAPRLVPVDPAVARKEFMQKLNKMSGEEIRRKKNNDPQFVKELATFGIKIQ